MDGGTNFADYIVDEIVDMMHESHRLKEENQKLKQLVQIWKQREEFSSDNRSDYTHISWCIHKNDNEHKDFGPYNGINDDLVNPYGCNVYAIGDGGRSTDRQFNGKLIEEYCYGGCDRNITYCEECHKLNVTSDDIKDGYRCLACKSK